MKIGIYLPKYKFGGGEKVLLFLSNEFYKRGHEMVVFTGDHSILDANLPYTIVLYNGKNEGESLSKWGKMKLIRAKMKEMRLDYVILFYPQDFIFLPALITKTPIIASIRVSYNTNAKNLVKKILQRWWLSASRGDVFQTKKVMECAPKSIQSKSVVISNALMIDNSLELSKIPKTRKIVAVGRLDEQKGCVQLLEAFAKSANQHDFKLVYYGTGPLEETLALKIKQYALEDRVVLAGFSHTPEADMADAEIFVLNSKWEGMPNALVEAMSIGLACISTRFDTGASEFLIQHGENGLLVDYGDIEQLSDSILLLVKNEDLRKKIQSKAIYTRTLLDKDAIISRWIDYMNDIKR